VVFNGTIRKKYIKEKPLTNNTGDYKAQGVALQKMLLRERETAGERPATIISYFFIIIALLK
jgi:hypothetical protein